MLEELRKLSNSLQERERTITLQRILLNDLTRLELGHYKSNNKDKKSNETDKLYTNLVHLKALCKMALEELEEEYAQDFEVLHTLYDVYETHNLVPHSKVYN